MRKIVAPTNLAEGRFMAENGPFQRKAERERMGRGQLTSLVAKTVGWIEIAVAGAVGIPFGLFYLLYLVGRLFGAPRDDIGFIRGWYPMLAVFALTIGLSGWALIRGGWRRWWGQLPWLFVFWFLWQFG